MRRASVARVALAVATIGTLGLSSCSSSDEPASDGSPSEQADAAQTATGTVDVSTCTQAWEIETGFSMSCDVVLEDPPTTIPGVPIPEDVGAFDTGTGNLLVTPANGVFRVEVSRATDQDDWVVITALDG